MDVSVRSGRLWRASRIFWVDCQSKPVNVGFDTQTAQLRSVYGGLKRDAAAQSSRARPFVGRLWTRPNSEAVIQDDARLIYRNRTRINYSDGAIIVKNTGSKQPLNL